MHLSERLGGSFEYFWDGHWLYALHVMDLEDLAPSHFPFITTDIFLAPDMDSHLMILTKKHFTDDGSTMGHFSG